MHRKFRTLGDHAKRLITHAVPVAVRAVQHIAAPTLAEDFEFDRQTVRQTRCNKDFAHLNLAAVSELDGEIGRKILAVPCHGDDCAVMELAAEFADFTSADGQQFGGVHAVAGEESVHVIGGRVPW